MQLRPGGGGGGGGGGWAVNIVFLSFHICDRAAKDEHVENALIS